MRYILTLLFCVVLSAPALAELSIAVIDVDRVMAVAEPAKKLQDRRDETRTKFLSELSDKEKDLRAQGQALFEKRQDLSEEEFAKQRQAYESELLKVRKLTQERKRAFEAAAEKSLIELQNTLTEQVQIIAKEKGYTLVLTTRSVVTGENALDITDEAIKRMNESKIEIPFEIKK